VADPGIARGGMIFVGEAPKGYGMGRGTPTIVGLNVRVLSTKIVTCKRDYIRKFYILIAVSEFCYILQ